MNEKVDVKKIIINVKLIWFPSMTQVFTRKKNMPMPSSNSVRDYLRSVWIGFTAPILNLPHTVLMCLLSPTPISLLLRVIILTVWGFPCAGICGYLYGVDVTVEEAVTLHELGF